MYKSAEWFNTSVQERASTASAGVFLDSRTPGGSQTCSTSSRLSFCVLAAVAIMQKTAALVIMLMISAGEWLVDRTLGRALLAPIPKISIICWCPIYLCLYFCPALARHVVISSCPAPLSLSKSNQLHTNILGSKWRQSCPTPVN